jgi:hypothetical protein
VRSSVLPWSANVFWNIDTVLVAGTARKWGGALVGEDIIALRDEVIRSRDDIIRRVATA